MAEEDARSEGGEAAPKGGKKKLIIIAAAVLLVLLIGGGAAFFFLSGGDDESARSSAPVQREAIYVKIRTLEGRPMFVASLENPDGNRHFMQIYAEAKTRDPAVEAVLNQHMPLIVARLNTLFTTADPRALRSVDGIRTLQRDATELVNRLIQDRGGEPGVEIVLFTNFVMQ
ncbi:MAG: flagellar basal body-associated FliL family protein [Nitrincola lacisaponensis]|uniref:Flagellar protein FliL n=1 Tax=Nitrincola lacisaponensis TaxID=267850 RepID=A0A063Y1P9_9GAMM|nr:flagellar basal body-associated FliL family protein [Nitrincola lacisaponensis]KDE39599.1 Flagellar biosynthesis protein FliL [Nitrincola lacisaponensis]